MVSFFSFLIILYNMCIFFHSLNHWQGSKCCVTLLNQWNWLRQVGRAWQTAFATIPQKHSGSQAMRIATKLRFWLSLVNLIRGQPSCVSTWTTTEILRLVPSILFSHLSFLVDSFLTLLNSVQFLLAMLQNKVNSITFKFGPTQEDMQKLKQVSMLVLDFHIFRTIVCTWRIVHWAKFGLK